MAEIVLTVPPNNGENRMSTTELPAGGYGHWIEKLYGHSHHYDQDDKFFVDALKSAHLEGKMSAREMTFTRHLPPQSWGDKPA